MKKTVYAYLHTHWDREWYRNKEDFNIRLKKVFDIILDELKNNKAPFFYFDGQTSALIDYLKYNPQKTEFIKKLIQNQKLAIGPYFVSADSYLVSFPLMLKNLDLGLEYSINFGQKEFIGYMSDVFGVSKSIFSALNLKHIDKAIIWRGVNPKYTNNNCNFLFQNTKTLWLSMGYFNDFIHTNNIKGLNDYIDKIFKYSKDNCLLPIGADHLGILKNASDTIEKINKNLTDYEIKLTSPFEYFKKNKFTQQAQCEEFLDNKLTYILQGVYSTRINQKIKNVEIENKLTKIVEPLNYYLNGNYSSYIEEVYKTLLKNHAHDSIYGCSLDSTASAVDNRFNKCEQISNSILLHLMAEFKNRKNIKGNSKDKIGLFNLTNSSLDVVKIRLPYILNNAQIIKTEKGFCDEILSDCYKIPVTEDICNIYTQLIEVEKNKGFSFNSIKIKKPKKSHSIKNNFIENKNIGLYVKNKKIYIKNKKNNNEVLFKITDIKDNGDSYNFAPKGKRKELEIIKSEMLYKGEIQSVLRLYFKDITLDAVLDNHSKYLKFNASINNKTKNHKLQAAFIYSKDIKKTVAQDAVGIISRNHDTDYKMEDYMPAHRPNELKTNSYPLQNFVSFGNTSILTKGLHEYEIYKNELRICLLRCSGTISNPKNPARAIPAGPDLKIPNAQLLGKNNAEFAFIFGSEKQAFLNLDKFSENYVTIDGEFKKDFKIEFDNIEKESYFYGINNGKKIIYNINNKEINYK